MTNLIRTDSDNADFRELVRLLDEDLQIRDGEDHSFYAQYNEIDKIRYVVVAYQNDQAVGCGAIKEYAENAAEVKRMFVRPENRGQGIAKKILAELEIWAAGLNYSQCILETGKKTSPKPSGFIKKAVIKRFPTTGNTKMPRTAFV